MDGNECEPVHVNIYKHTDPNRIKSTLTGRDSPKGRPRSQPDPLPCRCSECTLCSERGGTVRAGNVTEEPGAELGPQYVSPRSLWHDAGNDVLKDPSILSF